MRPKVFLSRPWPRLVEDDLRSKYELTVNRSDSGPSIQDFIEIVKTFDAICPTVTDRLPAEVFQSSPCATKIIANYGAGFEHIDLTAAARAQIVVTNTPDVLTEATADIAVLLMLMTSRRATEGEAQLRKGEWKGWQPTHLMGQSLSGKTLGLVGFGRIAQETARRANSTFGMKIAYYSRRDLEIPNALFIPSLHELAAVADVLSLHIPGGLETRGIIDASVFHAMKPTGILINTARGSVVNESDLAHALSTNEIWAAGLDVYENEPVVSPLLLDLPNIVLLPHLGSATVETRTAMGLRAVANLDAFFRKEVPIDRLV